jgi:hypothetical protein
MSEAGLFSLYGIDSYKYRLDELEQQDSSAWVITSFC